MQLLHHQPMMTDVDGKFVCSRCGMINPSDEQPCVPVDLDPATNESSESAE